MRVCVCALSSVCVEVEVVWSEVCIELCVCVSLSLSLILLSVSQLGSAASNSCEYSRICASIYKRIYVSAHVRIQCQ